MVDADESLPDFGQFLAGAAADDAQALQDAEEQRELAAAALGMFCNLVARTEVAAAHAQAKQGDGVDRAMQRTSTLGREFSLPHRDAGDGGRRLLHQGGFVSGVRIGIAQDNSEEKLQSLGSHDSGSSDASGVGPKIFQNTKLFVKRRVSTIKSVLKLDDQGTVDSKEALSCFKSVKTYVEWLDDRAGKEVDTHSMTQGFLFDDCLVLAKPTAEGMLVVSVIPLNCLALRDVGSGTYTFEDSASLIGGEDDEGSEDEDHGDTMEDSDHRGMSLAKHMVEVTDIETMEKVLLDCGGDAHKGSWLNNIFNAAASFAMARQPDIDETDIGWKHRILRGTLWAAALEGNPYQVGCILRQLGDCNRAENDASEASQLQALTVDAADGRGATAVHYAALAGHGLVVKQLLNASSSQIYALDNDLMTPLHYAAKKCRAMAARALLNSESDGTGRGGIDESILDARDIRDQTPALLSCVVGCTEAARARAAGKDEAASQIELACGDMLHTLSAHGADLASTGIGKETCVLIAARLGAGAVLATLLALNAGLESREGADGALRGRTVLGLMSAQRPPNVLLVSKVLAAGANVNVKDADGNTPLHLAAGATAGPSSDSNSFKCGIMGDDERDLAQLLVSHGARLDLNNAAGLTCSQVLEMQGLDCAAAAAEWVAREEPAAVAIISKHHPYRLPYATEQGSSNWEEDAKECRGCAQPFGMLLRRTHCRHCGRSFCNACCSKQFTLKPLGQGANASAATSGAPIKSKVCPGCFNKLSRTMMSAAHELGPLTPSASEAARESLFGDRVAAALNKGSAAKKEDQQPIMGKVQATMAQAQEALAERGEKLSRLAEKSEAMNNNAANFSNYAKMLREREERKAGWFGLF